MKLNGTKIAFIGIIVILVLGMFMMIGGRYNAQADSNRYKYYTSYEVHTGDTLWSIAQEYCSDEYHNYNEYIAEVKRINHIGNDIKVGDRLSIPYFSDLEVRKGSI